MVVPQAAQATNCLNVDLLIKYNFLRDNIFSTRQRLYLHRSPQEQNPTSRLSLLSWNWETWKSDSKSGSFIPHTSTFNFWFESKLG